MPDLKEDCMTTVLQFPMNRAHRPQPDEALVAAIVENRWPHESVFWLKEVAEMLLVLEECSDTASPAIARSLAEPLAGLPERLRFFPQYYRFFLSIALSAQALGLMDQDATAGMVDWVADNGWVDSELADLHRAEARYLLRRGGRTEADDPGLERRIHRFLERPATFAIPNRKAAYELTHLVFYLSNRGRVDPGLSPLALQSLGHAGTLAFLDQNADLLAEICLCLIFCGQVPPTPWVALVEDRTTLFSFEEKSGMAQNDECHCVLVCNWLLGKSDRPAFQHRIPTIGRGKTLLVSAGPQKSAPLRELSVFLQRLGTGRTSDWSRLRSAAEGALSPDAREVLWQAEAADDDFGEFFAAFSRSGKEGVA
jgi:hypothetical protein